MMSVHPRFSAGLVDGQKTVEFRKRRLAPDVRRVLIDFMGGQAGHAPTFCRRRLTHVAASIGAASIG